MLVRFLSVFSAITFISFSFINCSKTESERFDILIMNGQIVDGTGNPGFSGDIGIKGDTIAEIGDLSGKAADKTIDAEGLVVSPGFIDMHNHSDYALGQVSSNVNLNFLTQGVTTTVTGQCGGCISLKVSDTKAEWEEQGIGTNVVYLVGHGDIRREVMGVEPREATPEEIEMMKAVLRRSMEEGAWGMSTGLDYIPGRYSNTEEIIELTKIVGEYGGIYTSHIRDEDENIVESVQETIRIGEESGVPVNIGHLKVTGKNNWGLMKDVVMDINNARARGVNITADQYPYVQSAPYGPIYSFMRLPENLEPLSEIREKLRDVRSQGETDEKLVGQYVDELKKALNDKAKRELIKKMTVEGLPHAPSPVAIWGWHDNSVIISEKYAHLVGKNFIDIFEELGGDPFDIIEDFVLGEPDMLYAGGSMSEEEVQLALKQEWVMISSDGGAAPMMKEDEEPKRGHPRDFGSFTKVFRKYVREEEVLSVENAVEKMTSLPASVLGMTDRGSLAEGHKADLTVFNLETVKDNATYADSERYSTGVEYVIVNGKIEIENGEHNGSLHGKVLLLTGKNQR